MNISETSLSTNYSGIIITFIQHQNFIVCWIADALFTFSKILKIGVLLHLITSVEVDVNFDIRSFEVFQSSNWRDLPLLGPPLFLDTILVQNYAAVVSCRRRQYRSYSEIFYETRLNIQQINSSSNVWSIICRCNLSLFFILKVFFQHLKHVSEA